MRIRGNYLCEVEEMQASSVLGADNGGDEENEEDEDEERHGREFDICTDCWHPIEEKLKGKGRPKRRREMVFLPPQAAPEREPDEPKKAAWATEDFWQVELGRWP